MESALRLIVFGILVVAALIVLIILIEKLAAV